VVLFARDDAARALAANRDATLLGVEVDLVARQAWQFGREHEAPRGFVQVDGRCPPGRVGPDELPDLFLQGQEIPQRIPPRERHEAILAWAAAPAACGR
jgi:hypothetical protein